MYDDILCTLKKVISSELGIDEQSISATSVLRDDLGADSLDIIELTMRIEDTFKIEIVDIDIEKITTVNDVCQLLLAKGKT